MSKYNTSIFDRRTSRKPRSALTNRKPRFITASRSYFSLHLPREPPVTRANWKPSFARTSRFSWTNRKLRFHTGAAKATFWQRRAVYISHATQSHRNTPVRRQSCFSKETFPESLRYVWIGAALCAQALARRGHVSKSSAMTPAGLRLQVFHSTPPQWCSCGRMLNLNISKNKNKNPTWRGEGGRGDKKIKNNTQCVRKGQKLI